ncbi:hypothetical protein HC891_10250 [Candidatus Gracilibacteria bacterium]|nr:hypothetical protein [Candidatus Gracilibacteria bacterium]
MWHTTADAGGERWSGDVRCGDGAPGCAVARYARAGCGVRECGFPWWTLWLIWPLLGLIKAASAALAPLLVLLTTPLALEVTLLPLLLIGAGVALVLLGRRAGR